MKIIITTALVSLLVSFAVPVWANQSNNLDRNLINNHTMSGFFVSASAGLAQSKSVYNYSYSNVLYGYNINTSFPAQNQGAVHLGLGYQFGFGNIDTLKNFYTGMSVNYNNYGKVVDPLTSKVVKKGSKKGTILSTNYMQLNTINFEGFIGMHFASPVSAQIGLGVGNKLGNQQNFGWFGLFNAQIGYNLTKHLQLYLRYTHAVLVKDSVDLPALCFWVASSSESQIRINSEQIGLKYIF
ncbi:MAG: hypothetical protein EP298_03800 [Gammaproteobacteria bacterium]|nr:MAG: hypothetical protein EP298_03800 [Gammaproteobacteria bacterium]UTW43754.1 hypothetical protein KFE69_06605 [bacterium SCSIO 12844]